MMIYLLRKIYSSKNNYLQFKFMNKRMQKAFINIQIKKEIILKGFAINVLGWSLYIQFLVVLIFILINSPSEINRFISIPIEWMRQTIILYPQISMAVSLLNIFFIELFLFLLWSHRTIQENHHQQDFSTTFSKNISFIAAFLQIILQFLLVPSLIIIVLSIQAKLVSVNIFTSILNIMTIFLLCPFMVKQSNSYLYSYKFILIFLIQFIEKGSIYLLTFLALSIAQGIKQTSKIKTFYFECSWLLFLEFVVFQTGDTIITAYLILIMTIIPISISITSTKDGKLSEVQENNILFKYIQKMHHSLSLSLQDQSAIYEIVYRFKEKNKYNYKPNMLQNKDLAIFNQIDKKICIQSLKSFLILKLQTGIENNEFYMISRIQKQSCKLFQSQFSIKHAYQIQKFKNQFEDHFSFKERIEFQTLVYKIQQSFLKRYKSENNRIIINMEKQVESFYQYVVSIIGHVQYIWNRIKLKNLQQCKLYQKLNQIINLERKCEIIINKLIPFRNMSNQIEAFNYLMAITNVHHQIIFQWKRMQLQKIGKQNQTNFIQITNHKIVDLSINLAHIINLRKVQLIGKSIEYLFAKSLKNYVPKNFQKLLKSMQTSRQIILPLKMSGMSQYVLPFKTKFDILPNINGGLQYVIHILESLELRKFPIFIYLIGEDQITNVTKNFFSYLGLPSRRIESYIQGIQIFNTDIGLYINFQTSPIGHTFHCNVRLLKMVKSKKNDNKKSRHLGQQRVQFKILEIYDIDNQKIAMIELKLQTKEGIETEVNLGERLLHKQIQIQLDKPEENMQSNQTYCKIPSRFGADIKENMSKPNHIAFISYLKIIWLLIGLIIAIVVTVLAVMMVQISTTGSNLSEIMSESINTNTKIQQIYLLMYQYYQYYQILNFPQQLLAIQAYNMTAEDIQYKKKAQNNINILLQQLYNGDLGQSSLPYTLQFQDYSTVDYTSSISLVDLMADVTFAIGSNNPVAMVRNEGIIDTIISSYLPPSLDQINKLVQLSFNFLVLSLLIIMIIILILKCFHLYLVSIIRQILNIYELIDVQYIKQNQHRLNQYIQILKQSNIYPNQSQNNDVNAFKQQKNKYSKIQIDPSKNRQHFHQNLQVNSESQQEFQIQRQSIFYFLIQNKIFWILPLIILLYYGFYYQQISIYQSNIIEIVNYQQNIQNSIVIVCQKAQLFFQSAMQQNLPIDQRKNIPKQTSRNFSISFQNKNLPSFFVNYKTEQRNILGYNLCNYSYLNNGSLYKNINCSLILNGIMETGFSQAYFLYFDLVESNLGVSIKDLGITYRTGATYPVFMEICYLRRTVFNMLTLLQGQFNSLVTEYIAYQNNYIQMIIYIGFCLIPIIVMAGYFFTKQFNKFCQIGLKTFQIIPKNFLLKRSITKLLIKKAILKKLSWFF